MTAMKVMLAVEISVVGRWVLGGEVGFQIRVVEGVGEGAAYDLFDGAGVEVYAGAETGHVERSYGRSCLLKLKGERIEVKHEVLLWCGVVECATLLPY